jgi:hypothetical protein
MGLADLLGDLNTIDAAPQADIHQDDRGTMS